MILTGCFISNESRLDSSCWRVVLPHESARFGDAVRLPPQILRGSWLSLAIGMAVLAGGCDQGPIMGQVSGRVTFGGEPVTQGTILFFPVTGPGAVGLLDDDGKFSMKTNGKAGVIVGQNIVSITPPTDLAVIGMPAYPGAPPNVKFENIPQKFHRGETSDLQVNVQEGNNEFNFELKE